MLSATLQVVGMVFVILFVSNDYYFQHIVTFNGRGVVQFR